ncbi:ABC transporter substrate-binding protein [Robbsia andropogonis]|uniref:ABC transporter substrate-binding protein n=1 Tax=Robbsia andropogonis TaxID=28092 RepID=UPI003D24B35C
MQKPLISSLPSFRAFQSWHQTIGAAASIGDALTAGDDLRERGDAGRRAWLRQAVSLGAAAASASLSVPAWAVSTASGAGQVSDAALRNVTLRVGDQTGATRGLFEAAGLLKDVPFKIEWSVFPTAAALHEALKANATDIGSANDSPTVTAIVGGSPVQVVAAWQRTHSTDTALLTRPNSGIASLQGLRGKTISPTTRGSVGHFLVVGLLQQAGIPLSDVKLAFLAPTDASAAFASGGIDAWSTWGIFRARTVGVLHAQTLDDGARINSGLSLLSAHPEALKDSAKVAAIAHFARLQDRALAWGQGNRAGYIDWFKRFSKQDDQVAAGTYNDAVGYQRQPIGDGVRQRVDATYKTWIGAGLLQPGADLAAHLYHGITA